MTLTVSIAYPEVLHKDKWEVWSKPAVMLELQIVERENQIMEAGFGAPIPGVV